MIDLEVKDDLLADLLTIRHGKHTWTLNTATKEVSVTSTLIKKVNRYSGKVVYE